MHYMGTTKTVEKGVMWVYDKVISGRLYPQYSATSGNKFITPERGRSPTPHLAITDGCHTPVSMLTVNQKLGSL